jgi:2-methylcitrate dehydratase PrpD
MNTDIDQRPALEEMASYLHAVGYDDLPSATVAQIKTRIIDTIGVAIAATNNTSPQRAADMARHTSTGGDAALLGFTDRVSAAEAAFVNGVLAHTLDYDDTHLPSIVHPSSTVVPATLAVAEQTGADGRDLLTAAAVGYEVCIRTAMGGYSEEHGSSVFFDRGWHATSICGTLGAAAAAAVLYGLDEDGLAHAIAIAASFGSGILEANRVGGTVKQLHCGWAARAGIFAADAAAHGFTGPSTVFEGRFGFFEAFCGGLVNPGALTDSLGENWLVDEVATKPFPTNHFTHSAICAATDLRLELDGAEIEWVELAAPTATLRTIAEPPEMKAAPKSIYHAKFSAPFLIAMTLTFPGQGLGLTEDDLTRERLDDPGIRDLAARTRCVSDPALDGLFPRELPAILRVGTRDGRICTREVLTTFGAPSRPLTEEQLRVKFESNVVPMIGESRSLAIWDHVIGVDTSSARELGAALTGEP